MRRLFAITLAAWLSVPLAGQVLAPRDFRGTNYLPATTFGTDNVLGLLPHFNVHSPYAGNHFALHSRSEILKIGSAGFNTIRIFPSFYAWVIDPDGYFEALGDIARTCAAKDLKMTVVVWNAIGVTGSVKAADGVESSELWHELVHRGSSSRREQVYLGAIRRAEAHNQLAQSIQAVPVSEPFAASLHVEPGNELFALGRDYRDWPYQISELIDRYLDQLGRFFAEHADAARVLASFDLFNEPNGGELLGIPVDAYIEFIKVTYDRLAARHPHAHYTVGWAGDDDDVDRLDDLLLTAGIGRTYVSIHSYSGVERTRRRLERRAAFAADLGVDLVVSEFYRTDLNAGVLKYILATIDELGMGGQIWGFLQTNTFTQFPPFGFAAALDGIYVPVASGNTANPIRYEINNPFDHVAVNQWVQGDLVVGPYSAMTIRDQNYEEVDELVAGQAYTVTFSSTQIQEPVLVLADLYTQTLPPPCEYPNGTTCFLLPGLGLVYNEPTAFMFEAGTTDADGFLEVPGFLYFPPGAAGSTLSVNGYIGDGNLVNFSQNEGEALENRLIPIR